MKTNAKKPAKVHHEYTTNQLIKALVRASKREGALREDVIGTLARLLPYE